MPKQFKAVRDKRPPLEFEITYERLIDSEWVEQTEKFRARSTVAGGVMLNLAAAMDAEVGIQSAELVRLLNAAIWPEDKQQFQKFINDPDTAISIETLADILSWLAEEYAERPIQSV